VVEAMPQRSRCSLVESDDRHAVSTIPSRDRVFRRVVQRVADDSGGSSAEQLVERLRPFYPRVAVFERQLSGERRHFYVYRDGHYELEPSDRWWEQPGVACVRVSVATGRLTYVSGEWGTLMGADPAELVDRHYTDFVAPDARDAAAAMFEAVSDERDVGSEALVVRADGSTLAIEFRATLTDGEIDVRYRPLGR
jgi:PAS domain S-box-containing protein